MPLLTRKKVLTIDRNRITTLPTTLGNTASAENIVLDAVASLDVERIDRNFSTPSLTSIKDLAGQKAAEFTFGIELKGSNDLSAEPEWSKILDGCGFKGEAISSLQIGAITSGGVGGSTSTTFRHLELITAAGGATARVVMDTHNGSSEVYIDTSTITGTFTSSELITGEDSDATATTTTTSVDEGFAWWPISVVEKQILFDSTGLEGVNLAVGDLIAGTVSGARGVITEAAVISTNTIITYTPIRGTFANLETMERINPTPTADIGDLADPTAESFAQFAPMGIRMFTDGKAITGNGCRGNVVFNMEVNRPVRMDFTFRGQLVDTNDAVLLTGIDFENNDPPLWESSSIGYAQNETAAESDVSDEFEPCLQAVTFDIGNQNTDRKCAGATNGLLEVATSARDATGSMTVEDTLEADIGWLTRIQDNETIRLRMTIGSTAGNRFTIAAPGIQFISHGEGDTDGIVTQDMSFRLTGGNLFDIIANNTLNAIGGDNEIVIVYHTAV